MKKHITRDYTGHKKEIIRPDEYIMFECFSYDHYYTRPILCEDVQTSNAFRTYWRSYDVLRSNDKVNHFNISFDYTVPSKATYRVDLLYEQSDILYNNPVYDSNEDIVGSYRVTSTNFDEGDDLLFDGENHCLKRITLFHDLDPKTYNFNFEIPPNCFFIGAIVRKLITYTGDNVDTAGTNLQFTKADWTNSDMCKSSELQVTIGYDDALEYPASPSGFYIDYMDECNLYVKDVDENIIQTFGGYVSSIQEDDDRTNITIHCADRLQGGENKFILTQLVLKGGTTSLDSNEYTKDMEKSFDSYAQALDYLCSCYEVTLSSNIDENYLVGGEKYHKGFVINYGTRNKKLKVNATNGGLTNSKNFVILRNNSSASKQQVFTVYDSKSSAQSPVLLNKKGNDVGDNYGWMHITYGMGKAVTESQQSVKEQVKVLGYKTVASDSPDLFEDMTVDVTDISQSLKITYNKCGVSSDGKYVMAIGRETKHAGSKKYPYKNLYKSLFLNYCPHCKKWGILRWHYNKSCSDIKRKQRKTDSDGEITCIECDNDFNITDGYKKISGSKLHLTKAATTVKSSKSELNQLLSGNMVEVTNTAPKVEEEDVFKNIAKVCNKYTYDPKSGSTASYLMNHYKGDSFAFSELIFNMLTKYGVLCKIVESANGKKRSVLYKNKKKNWVNFPYRKYNFDSHLSPVANATSAKMVKENKVGGTINQLKELAPTTKTKTTKVTHTYGYDKDKPFQAYLKIGFSTSSADNAKVYYIYPSFTLTANESASITGLNTFWINSATREATIPVNLVDFIKNTFPMGDTDVYLRTIQFITPTAKDNWYTYDKTVKDESSCKLNLYQIVFNDNKGVSPSDLNCCGKNINDVFTEIVEDADYVVFMDYAKHRCDDKINFNVVDQSIASFRAEEGDNNNILKWGNINYTPVSKLHNKSTVVYKSTNGLYYYVDTIDANSILNYEEQISLQSENEVIGEKQAYYMARNNNDFNPNQTYTYSVTVPGYPNIHLKDLVEVVSDKRKLNTVEVLEAISMSYDINQIPRIQTELSLGELPDEIMVSNSLKKLRESTKKNTIFGTTATPNNNKNVYTWDK